ncbi:Fc.00g042100.m01.CDS01 [Cosmosporella sp. VM-42]
MGLDYALVHLKFTIPLAVFLTVAGRPFLTRLDLVRVVFLVTIAVIATIPWDSYLIRTGVWTYPEDGILGYTLFDIPVEELFFFVIQTWITSLLYIFCNKPVLHAQYLNSPATTPKWISRWRLFGQVLLAGLSLTGGYLVRQGSDGTYLGLILAWACPFALFTWSLTGEFMLALPWTSTVLPIVVPTIYLWLVDELSIRNGVWTIETGSKFGVPLFGSLDIEEAIFFLASNTLVVFGIAAFDRAVAVCDAFPELFPHEADSLPVKALLRARVTPSTEFDMRRIIGLRQAVTRLSKKSRSFYLSSSVFPGRLRINLTYLYSYCRIADDLVDGDSTPVEAIIWIQKLWKYLKMNYDDVPESQISDYIRGNFPSSAVSGLELLPTTILQPDPLYGLLNGFKTDVKFALSPDSPIQDELDLESYAADVAGTVGQLCLDLVYFSRLDHLDIKSDKSLVYAAAREMGIALQYVNIARDIAVDARMHRVYLPCTWLKEEDLTPDQVISCPSGPKIERMRKRLLGKAFAKYRASRKQMEYLPREVRGAMMVAVESYMEIGRVLAEGGSSGTKGRATVPKRRRLVVVWKTLWNA